MSGRMRASVGTWGEDGATPVPHAEVVALPAKVGQDPPDGAIQMAWTDVTGFTHRAHVVKWWRLDRQGLGPGVQIQVDVQARQRRDLACPPHHLSADLVVTGDPTDQAQVMIGDPDRVGMWAYGVVFFGAALVRTAVLPHETAAGW